MVFKELCEVKVHNYTAQFIDLIPLETINWILLQYC